MARTDSKERCSSRLSISSDFVSNLAYQQRCVLLTLGPPAMGNVTLGSWGEGIGVFHGETGFADLRRVGGGDAGELRSDVVDDVEIAVGAIVVAQTKIGAGSLGVGGVHLDQAGEGKETSEGIVRLQVRQHD